MSLGNVTITLNSVSRMSAVFNATTGSPRTKDIYSIEVYDNNSHSGTPVSEEYLSATPGSTETVTVSGLAPETTYYAFLKGDTLGYDTAYVEFTTAEDDPMMATASQWQDLAARMKELIPPMTVVNTSTYPTSRTPGVVGQLYYMNYGSHYLFVCTSNENGVTTWQQIQLMGGADN